MKIGIVTYFRVANYGAMLQAYALWHVLSEMGHEVVFVSCPFSVAKRISLWRCFVSRKATYLRKKIVQYLRFPMTKFAMSFPQTKFCNSLDDCRKETAGFDVLIVGSDQMWNPMWNSGVNLRYVMLDFAPASVPRIAYAVSFGAKEWQDSRTAKEAGALISKFRAVSVRESSGMALAKLLSGSDDVECLLDPTLLHNKDFYLQVIKTGSRVVESVPYIFKYMIEDLTLKYEEEHVLEKVTTKTGVSKIKSDRVKVKGVVGRLCGRMLGIEGSISVPEWMNSILQADYVVTNSFHGTAFSIIFHRPFITLLLTGEKSGMNERILSLLESLGLRDRAVYANEDVAIHSAICGHVDWKKVDELRARQGEASKKWLRESLAI